MWDFKCMYFFSKSKKVTAKNWKACSTLKLALFFFYFPLKSLIGSANPFFTGKVLRQSIFTLCMPALSMLIQSPMFPHLPALLFFFSNIPALDLLRIFIFNYQTQFQPHKSLITSLPWCREQEGNCDQSQSCQPRAFPSLSHTNSWDPQHPWGTRAFSKKHQGFSAVLEAFWICFSCFWRLVVVEMMWTAATTSPRAHTTEGLIATPWQQGAEVC